LIPDGMCFETPSVDKSLTAAKEDGTDHGSMRFYSFAPFLSVKIILLRESDASIFQHLHRRHLWCQYFSVLTTPFIEKFASYPSSLSLILWRQIRIRSWTVELQRSKIYMIYVCQPTISTCH